MVPVQQCCCFCVVQLAADTSQWEIYPLVVPVKVLELPLLLLLLPGLMRLLWLTPVELCIPVCKSLRVEAPLPFVLGCWLVVYQVERVLLWHKANNFHIS